MSTVRAHNELPFNSSFVNQGAYESFRSSGNLERDWFIHPYSETESRTLW
jgi:hypothetical protein